MSTALVWVKALEGKKPQISGATYPELPANVCNPGRNLLGNSKVANFDHY